MPAQVVDNKRRLPRQQRAAATVEAILEAAAQILEAEGLAGFTTNRVAERAGVSIGSLYQYFADKEAVLRRLAEQEMGRALEQIGRIAATERIEPPADRTRLVVRTMLRAFGGRQKARKAVIQAALAQGFAAELMRPVQRFALDMSRRINTDGRLPIDRVSPTQAFVLTRAVMGVIRAAVLEESPLLRAGVFEDELVRLIESYLRAVAGVAPPEG